jgi:hypothetical protein
MKVPKLLLVVVAMILIIPAAGCNLIGQNPLTALGSLVPQTTPGETVEATVQNPEEATVENTPLIRTKTPAPTTKPKATIAKTAEPTIKPKATIKPTATKKATLAPTKAATSNASSSLPTGAQLYSDDFSDPTSGWADGGNELSEWGYQNGVYVITVHAKSNLAWSYANQYYTDFVAEIEGAKVSGPNDGEYGMLFRFVDNDNFYIFKVNAQGSFIVSALVNNEWVTIGNWTKSSAIKLGTNSNKLAVVAQGQTFSLYINNTKVYEFTDDTFIEGDVAIVAGTQAVGEYVAKFMSVNVWEVAGETSPTSEPGSSITKGAKLYTENFSDPTSGWDEWDRASSRGGYEANKYFIEVLNPDQFSWGNGYQNFDDFVLEVDASKVAGPDDGGFGIILRYVDMDNFYYFAVSNDGQYRFSYYLNNERTDIISWTASDAIKQGNALNKLSVACKGNHFILSINGTVVEDFTDDTFSSGDIGLLAGTQATAGVKVTFDNLVVYAVK